MDIRTNNHWRQFRYRYEVPADVLADQFDWTDKDFAANGDYSDGFIQYKGYWYHLGDFMKVRGLHESEGGGWDGYHGESAFSGVLIRVSNDCEEYQIATYTS